MDIQQKIVLIKQNLDLGGYTLVAKECVGIIEHVFRAIFRQYLTQLKEQDRLRIQQTELEVGKGQKGIESFTLGELLGLFRKSRFFEAWADIAKKEIGSLRIINLDELNQFRNKLIHHGQEVNRAEAEILFCCMNLIIDTFGLPGGFENEKPQPVRDNTGKPITQDNTVKRPSYLTEEEFWTQLKIKAPESYEIVEKLTAIYSARPSIEIIPGRVGLRFRKVLQDSQRKVSLFFIATDALIHIKIQASLQQFRSLSFDMDVVEQFKIVIQDVLQGYISPIQKVDLNVFNKIVFEFIRAIEQQDILHTGNKSKSAA